MSEHMNRTFDSNNRKNKGTQFFLDYACGQINYVIVVKLPKVFLMFENG